LPVEISGEADARRKVFFRLIFGQQSGYVCLAFLHSQNKKVFKEEFFLWPQEEGLILEAVNKYIAAFNVYFCPQLLSEPQRTKDCVVSAPVAWSDLDRCHPDNLFVRPSVTVQTSPGRFQAYWCLDGSPEVEDVESLSRRIAYEHANQGADKSGWDLTQLLRVPWTYNFKYMGRETPPTVEILEVRRTAYRMSEFEMYPQAEGFTYLDIPMPDTTDMIDGGEMLQRWRRHVNPIVWSLYGDVPKEGKGQGQGWSKPLWNLQMSLFESGMNVEEVFTVCRTAACNKYARDGRDPRLLWNEVCRAEVQHKKHVESMGPAFEEVDAEPLLSAETQHLSTTKLVHSLPCLPSSQGLYVYRHRSEW
jgi:hypothetical protein